MAHDKRDHVGPKFVLAQFACGFLGNGCAEFIAAKVSTKKSCRLVFLVGDGTLATFSRELVD